MNDRLLEFMCARLVLAKMYSNIVRPKLGGGQIYIYLIKQFILFSVLA